MSSWSGLHKGLFAETIFFYAMRSIPDSMRPPWFLGIREAEPEEDARGFDDFISLDVGVVPVQIKSSERQADKFRRRSLNEDVLLVVLKGVPDEMEIRSEMLKALEAWRNDKFAHMPRWRSIWSPVLKVAARI